MIIYAGSVGVAKSLGKKHLSSSISGNGEGVYTLKFENDSLEIMDVQYADNAGILCITNNKKFVYAANESKDFTGLNGSGGGVTAYRVNSDGKLSKINDSISYGSRTSYVSVTEDNKFLLASNHGSHTTVTCHYIKDKNGKWILKRGFDDSSIAVFKLNEDGGIGELADLKVFEGNGYWCHGGGQSTSHLHSVKIRGDIVVAGNRGADIIEVLRLQSDGKLSIINRFKTKPAFAPRHMDFHPFNNILYVVNENYAAVSTYKININNGEINELQTEKTMPDEYYVDNPIPNFQKREADLDEINTSGMADWDRVMTSDIHVTSNGQFVYVSNRCFKSGGSIAVFKINDDYTLIKTQVFSLEGCDPRGFNIINNEYIIIGLCDKNLVQIFNLDKNTGLILDKVTEIGVNSASSFLVGNQED